MHRDTEHILWLPFYILFAVYALPPVSATMATERPSGRSYAKEPSHHCRHLISQHILLEELVCSRLTHEAGKSREIIVRRPSTIVPEDRFDKLSHLKNISCRIPRIDSFLILPVAFPVFHDSSVTRHDRVDSAFFGLSPPSV